MPKIPGIFLMIGLLVVLPACGLFGKDEKADPGYYNGISVDEE